jgi:hypothetical protein
MVILLTKQSRLEDIMRHLRLGERKLNCRLKALATASGVLIGDHRDGATADVLVISELLTRDRQCPFICLQTDGFSRIS